MYQIIQFAVFYICTWIYWNKEKAKFYVTSKYLALYDKLHGICYSNNQLIIWYLVKLFFRYDILKSIMQKFDRFAVSLFGIKSKFENVESLHNKMKFSINDFFSKCDQIPRKLGIWSHLLNKSLMENFIFCAVNISSQITLWLLQGVSRGL